MNHWLESWVQWAASIGLNYTFLLDAYQRGTMLEGA
ncbi:amino acid ABC transporter permease, partial [Pseudomonas amygdali pv. mori str. 301020]